MDLTPNRRKGGRDGAHPGGKEAAQKPGNRGDTSGTKGKGVKKEAANRGANYRKGGGRRPPRLTAKPTGVSWDPALGTEGVTTEKKED